MRMKTKIFLAFSLAAVLALGSGMKAGAQVPPPSDPKVVATYCYHCGWIDVEKGETHRSDCPYVHGNSGASSSSASSSSYSHSSGGSSFANSPAGMIANTVTSALGQTLASWISGESKPDFSGILEDRPSNLVNANPGKSNGSNNVAYDERSGRVGIWDNNKRRWLLKPYYYEDLIINDLRAIRAEKKVKKENKWGLINADNWTIVPFEYGSTQGFQSDNAPVVFYYGDERKGPCRVCVPDETAKYGFRLLDEEFEDANLKWKGKMYVSVKKDGKWGVIGRNGAYIAEPAWEGVVPLGMDDTGADVMFTQTQTGWGLQAGERVILPHQFKWLSMNNANTNVIAKLENDKMGVANMQGRFFMEPVYDKIERFTTELVKGQEYFKVTKDGKVGLYTADGVMAAAPIYTEASDFEILALGAETQSYSQWLKREIRRLAATKDEFETTAAFEARKADDKLLMEYVNKVMPDPEAVFVKHSLVFTPRNPHKVTLSAYNADTERFQLTDSATPAFPSYLLHIPLEKAAAFKEEMTKEGKLDEAAKTAVYKVKDDRLWLEDMVFTLEDGSTYHLKLQ